MSSIRNGVRPSDRLVRQIAANNPTDQSLGVTEIARERRFRTRSEGQRNLTSELRSLASAQKKFVSHTEAREIIEALLLIAMESVAAERGLLFLAAEAGVEVEAEATSLTSGVQVVFSRSLTAAPKFSQSVLRHVVRFEEVVLHEPSAGKRFAEEDYLNSKSIQSILCLPLLAWRDLIGVLYLENLLRSDALASHRIGSLQMLVSQGAIALNAAALKTKLEDEINHRRKTEQELERVLSVYGSLGTLAQFNGLAVVLAHELAQPLQAILLNAEYALQLLESPDPNLKEVSAAIGDIISTNERASATARSVRSALQRDAPEMSTVDLIELIHEVRDIVSLDAARRGIAVRLDLPPAISAVSVDRTQIVQVLVNLVMNAFEAMAETDGQVREVEIGAFESESARVSVFVRDSGKGITPEVKPLIFNPFFTTKSTGLGMGLAIAKSIMMKHGGHLWAKHNPDRGATFIFDLPIKR
jgi:signal transduction histidine kinase